MKTKIKTILTFDIINFFKHLLHTIILFFYYVYEQLLLSGLISSRYLMSFYHIKSIKYYTYSKYKFYFSNN